MFKIELIMEAFKGERSRALSEAYLQVVLNALYELNRLWLRRHPETPRLYDSGVYYRAEPLGEERWRDIPSVLRDGYGDCEDLACWRAAELAERDHIAARPTYRWRRRPGLSIYHILVRYPDGKIEDPSRKLGMGTDDDRTIRKLTGAIG